MEHLPKPSPQPRLQEQPSLALDTGKAASPVMPDAQAAQQDQEAVAGPSGWRAVPAPVEQVAVGTASPTPSPSSPLQHPPPQPEPRVSVGTAGMVHLELPIARHFASNSPRRQITPEERNMTPREVVYGICRCNFKSHLSPSWPRMVSRQRCTTFSWSDCRHSVYAVGASTIPAPSEVWLVKIVTFYT